MIEVVSTDLQRLALGAKEVPKPLRAAIRKNLRPIAVEGANASKAKIRAMPSKGNRQASLRADIAQAIRVAPSVTAARGASVKIRIANTPALQAHRRFRAAQLLDKGKKFRHPYFGEWVEGEKDQMPYPYFRSVIAERAPQMRAAMHASLAEAVRISLPNAR